MGWLIGPILIDQDGVKHLSLVTPDARHDECFVPCRCGWLRVLPRFQDLAYSEGMVTCVVCVMFVVYQGRISLWVPSLSS